MKTNRLSLLPSLVLAALLLGNPSAVAQQKIRVGHFSNVTHAPVLIAKAQQHFEIRLDQTAVIEWKIFNAGPEAIEALFAGAIDLLYVGPNPAVNGFLRSKGEVLRVIAGVTAGGSAFVVRPDAGIERFEDIRGKRVASPQRGNTQDVSFQYLMKEKGLLSKAKGGDVEVFHLAGGDQVTAFLKKQVDAVWTVEPWVSRLVAEAGGKILFEESHLWPRKEYPTTLLVARKQFIDEHPNLVEAWVAAHVENIHWVNQNYEEAKRLFNEEFKRETGKALPHDLLEQSFQRIIFNENPLKTEVLEMAVRAKDLGYLGREELKLDDLYDLSFLMKVRGEKEKV